MLTKTRIFPLIVINLLQPTCLKEKLFLHCQLHWLIIYFSFSITEIRFIHRSIIKFRFLNSLYPAVCFTTQIILRAFLTSRIEYPTKEVGNRKCCSEVFRLLYNSSMGNAKRCNVSIITCLITSIAVFYFTRLYPLPSISTQGKYIFPIYHFLSLPLPSTMPS